MDIGRRALYTSLRLNWLNDPTAPVEDWQVEDYREMPYSLLFERLRLKGIYLDRVSFIAYAEQHDTPEELCEELFEGQKYDNKTFDQVYLIVFELWRRLLTDKLSVSIFCDELDHQIAIYDEGEVDNSEQIQDILVNLQVILEENTDQGIPPQAVFEYILSGCAHDIESFILDYLAEQIDHSNFTYASELLDAFAEYIGDRKWFTLQRARLIAQNDPRGANRLIQQLLELSAEDEDHLDFCLEVLHFYAVDGEPTHFYEMFSKIVPLLHSEEDFHDVVDTCIEFYKNQEEPVKVASLRALQAEKRAKNIHFVFSPNDEIVIRLRQIVTL